MAMKVSADSMPGLTGMREVRLGGGWGLCTTGTDSVAGFGGGGGGGRGRGTSVDGAFFGAEKEENWEG